MECGWVRCRYEPTVTEPRAGTPRRLARAGCLDRSRVLSTAEPESEDCGDPSADLDKGRYTTGHVPKSSWLKRVDGGVP